MEPIMEFKTEAQARNYLHEWQKRLSLSDWTIDIRLDDSIKDNQELGNCERIMPMKAATITLLKTVDNDSIVKECMECTLVHELLHLKIGILDENDTYESKINELHEHQLIEELAKALIMAKYNITLEWFRNF